VATTIDVFIEIPTLALLAGGIAAAELTGDHVAAHIQKLAFQPDTLDATIWDLPAVGPEIIGALDLSARTDVPPRIRCAVPSPEPGEVALYRVAILKSGVTLDSEGKRRDQQLHPTEEDLLFFVVNAVDEQARLQSTQSTSRLVPGVQRVVIPA
jgi:hypothetical protein